MNLFRKLGLAACVLALAVWANQQVVRAQNAGQTLLNLVATDLIQVYRSGTAAVTYVTYGMISAVTNTAKITPGTASLGGTGYSYTMGNTYGRLLMVLTGTMPYSYVTLAANPADGMRQCVFASGGAITALYAQANTGQTINSSAAISLSANTEACFVYSLGNLRWDRG